MDTGDFGEVEEQACECALGALGLTTHLRGIRSFEKLSGEGTTFVHTDLLRVLEEVLPARFGGAGDDYQVVETEQAEGILRLELAVSPRVGAVDPEQDRIPAGALVHASGQDPALSPGPGARVSRGMAGPPQPARHARLATRRVCPSPSPARLP